MQMVGKSTMGTLQLRVVVMANSLWTVDNDTDSSVVGYTEHVVLVEHVTQL